jgi:hypothetical protein
VGTASHLPDRHYRSLATERFRGGPRGYLNNGRMDSAESLYLSPRSPMYPGLLLDGAANAPQVLAHGAIRSGNPRRTQASAMSGVDSSENRSLRCWLFMTCSVLLTPFRSVEPP